MGGRDGEGKELGGGEVQSGFIMAPGLLSSLTLLISLPIPSPSPSPPHHLSLSIPSPSPSPSPYSWKHNTSLVSSRDIQLH